MMICKAVFLFLLTCLSLSAAAEPAVPAPSVRIAISQGGHTADHAAVFESTVRVLKAHFGTDKVEILHLPYEELSRALETSRVDFFISTSGLARRMEERGARSLLTIATPRHPDPSHAYGAIFFVRADSGIRTFEDMRGKHYVTNRNGGFYANLTAMGEIERRGYNHERFFSKSTYVGWGTTKVLDAVLSGAADVGSVPSCYFEDIWPGKEPEEVGLRAIGLQTKHPCRSSTSLYPNWTIGALRETPRSLSHEVAGLLLSTSTGNKDLTWDIAADFSAIDALYRSLQQGPYAFLRHWGLTHFLRGHWQWVAAALALMLFLVLNTLGLKALVRRRTSELQQALTKQQELQVRMLASENRFERLQKVTLVGQMSSMIAHELRQPLMAIQAYAHGLGRFIENGDIEKSEVLGTLTKISEQAQKSESIVERVRTYAKGEGSAPQRIDLATIIDQAAGAFRASGRFSGRFTVSAPRTLPALAVPLEIEVAVVNLLRNACEALAGQTTPAPMIHLELAAANDEARISVTDNGPAFPADDLDRLSMPLSTTKASGTGLGLPIVRTITENHGGSLIFTPGSARGLCATITIPLGERHELS